jgi:hypothetical protein
MDDAACVKEFERLADRLGIEIRAVSNTQSGLCTLKGRKILFLEKGLDSFGKLAVFAREFRGLDLDGMFLVPAIRKHLGLENERADW